MDNNNPTQTDPAPVAKPNINSATPPVSAPPPKAPEQKPPLPNPPPKIMLKGPKLNCAETQKVISDIETKLAMKVICYYTADNASIHDSHADLFLELLRKIGQQDKLALVIVSNGGSGTAALRIATILREYCRELLVVAPSRCASAATMIALAADKIILTPAGYLTAIDSSLNQSLNPKDSRNLPVSVSVDQIKRAIKFLKEEGPSKDASGQTEGEYRTLFKYIHPLAVAEIDRHSAFSELVAKKIMRMHPKTFSSQEQIDSIATRLVNDYPTHGFPIMFSEAIELGLPAEKADQELANDLWELVKFYDRSAMSITTTIAPDFNHLENFPVAIESLGQRVTHQYSYNRRLSQLTRSWIEENDNSRWVKITPSDDPAKPFVSSYLDVPDVGSVPGTKTDGNTERVK